MDSSLHLPDNRKGRSDLKKLLKPQADKLAQSDMPDVTDPGKRLAKLEKEVKALRKQVMGQQKVIEKLWARMMTDDMTEKGSYHAT